MERTVRLFLPLPGDPQPSLTAFLDEPLRWLPQGRRHERGLVSTLRAGGMAKSVLVQVGSPWVVGSTHWRSLRWDPINEDDGRPERLLPAFDGELGLHVLGPGRVTLILDGRYVPPGRSVGAALDGVALGRVAQRSLERYLEDLAENLQTAVPTPAGC
ncbi:hypothetical protein [Egicoccus halophilus]|uniref:Uncharacterized protein n=1 Tax=Egicoccus halophilus TaxID=1670830 RepID=A0A8J3A6U8_9ACTN|nr:hypothetical protein [Egicoccus halophilus]GGI05039.1 hypothetical protein GCM10011354_12090 [Egicoccus halophilus]